jgi:hypothetical protein
MPASEAQKRANENYRLNHREKYLETQRIQSLNHYHKNKEAISKQRKEKRELDKIFGKYQF